jgi:hypothetical protein
MLQIGSLGVEIEHVMHGGSSWKELAEQASGFLIRLRSAAVGVNV